MNNPPPLAAKIAARVEDIREAKGIKQAYVLASVPMSRETFSRIKRGERDLRTVEIFSIAGALRVSPVELIRPFLNDEAAA